MSHQRNTNLVSEGIETIAFLYRCTNIITGKWYVGSRGDAARETTSYNQHNGDDKFHTIKTKDTDLSKDNRQ